MYKDCSTCNMVILFSTCTKTVSTCNMVILFSTCTCTQILSTCTIVIYMYMYIIILCLFIHKHVFLCVYMTLKNKIATLGCRHLDENISIKNDDTTKQS